MSNAFPWEKSKINSKEKVKSQAITYWVASLQRYLNIHTLEQSPPTLNPSCPVTPCNRRQAQERLRSSRLKL